MSRRSRSRSPGSVRSRTRRGTGRRGQTRRGQRGRRGIPTTQHWSSRIPTQQNSITQQLGNLQLESKEASDNDEEDKQLAIDQQVIIDRENDVGTQENSDSGAESEFSQSPQPGTWPRTEAVFEIDRNYGINFLSTKLRIGNDATTALKRKMDRMESDLSLTEIKRNFKRIISEVGIEQQTITEYWLSYHFSGVSVRWLMGLPEEDSSESHSQRGSQSDSQSGSEIESASNQESCSDDEAYQLPTAYLQKQTLNAQV